MRKMIIGAAIAAISLSAPLAAQAQVVQDTVNGAQSGAAQGSNDAGPIGGIVGGAVGAGVGAATGAVGTATGIVGSIFGTNDEPRFHNYVTEQHRPSYDYQGDVRVGMVLPRNGVEMYPIPNDFHVNPHYTHYRYAVVNDQTVIVDPRTRRVVEVID